MKSIPTVLKSIVKGTMDPRHRVFWLIQHPYFKAEASKSFEISTKLQFQNLNLTLASRDWPNLSFIPMTKLELQILTQRWANNSVFEYYLNNIRIPKYSYSYSVNIFKPNNIRIRIRVIFSNRIIFVFVFGWFFQTE